jgi:hypothetical protein
MCWVQDPSRAKLPAWGVTEGTGAYEGWTYVYHVPDLMAPSSPEYGIDRAASAACGAHDGPSRSGAGLYMCEAVRGEVVISAFRVGADSTRRAGGEDGTERAVAAL